MDEAMKWGATVEDLLKQCGTYEDYLEDLQMDELQERAAA